MPVNVSLNFQLKMVKTKECIAMMHFQELLLQGMKTKFILYKTKDSLVRIT